MKPPCIHFNPCDALTPTTCRSGQFMTEAALGLRTPKTKYLCSQFEYFLAAWVGKRLMAFCDVGTLFQLILKRNGYRLFEKASQYPQLFHLAFAKIFSGQNFKPSRIVLIILL